jgi:hypothetical protein
MMTLRLDTTGLRQMIEDNPEFKLEIQQSVINNIKSDNIEFAVRDRITSLLKDMAVNEGSHYSPKIKIVDKTLLTAIKVAVQNEVKEIASAAIKNSISELIEQERIKLRSELKAVTRDAVMLALTPEMAKEILLAKLI